MTLNEFIDWQKQKAIDFSWDWSRKRQTAIYPPSLEMTPYEWQKLFELWLEKDRSNNET